MNVQIAGQSVDFEGAAVLMDDEHFAGLPLTEGKWVDDRDWTGALLGWLEMFSDGIGRWFSVPDASRYIRVSAAYR